MIWAGLLLCFSSLLLILHLSTKNVSKNFGKQIQKAEAKKEMQPITADAEEKATKWQTVISFYCPKGYRQTIETKLEHAGKSKTEAYSFIISKFRYAIVFACFAGVLHFLLDIPLYMMAVFGLTGWMVPSLKLSKAIKSRQDTIYKYLPGYLDLITLAVEAGMDLLPSVREIIRRDEPNPLKEELHLVLKSIDMGASRSNAFRQLAERNRIESLHFLSSAVSQSEELGSSLGGLLRQQSESVRRSLFRRAEEEAQRTPMKMLVPIIFFITPATAIILIAPSLFQIFSLF